MKRMRTGKAVKKTYQYALIVKKSFILIQVKKIIIKDVRNVEKRIKIAMNWKEENLDL